MCLHNESTFSWRDASGTTWVICEDCGITWSERIPTRILTKDEIETVDYLEYMIANLTDQRNKILRT